ncbi:MAG: acyl-CoA dehydrogenase family protein [Pseudomonadales bacterium]
MNFDLNEDQVAFRDTARQFAVNALAPYAAQWDADAHFPKDVLREAGDLGFMALYTPEEDGGLGLSRLDASVILEELAAGCTSTAAFMSIHNMALSMLAVYGSDKLKADWCAPLVGADKLASYCLTEPGSGSDAAALRTTAKRDGEHYIVNGSKAFISGAGDTDMLVLMARTGDKGPKGISAIAIPADSPGISYGKKEEKMGWNSQPTRTISFEDVAVPIDYLLGEEGQGFKIAMQGLDGGRINIAATAIGTAQSALESTLAYTQERKQFEQAISEFQVSQFKLADMATELVAARQMVRLAAVKLDSNHPEKTTYCAMAKRFATDVAFNVCNEALQLHGGYGYIREYPLERHVRDTRVHQILEGTNEIMRVIIARRLLSTGAIF